jgi:osmotically-inducible protein OsmY
MTKDVNLQNRVSEALEFEPGIHAEKIGVTVQDG